MQDEQDLVLTTRTGAVAQLTLNRPDRRNALTGPLAAALLETFTAASEDESVSVIVISGAGGAFCSGLDLKEFGADPRPDWIGEFPATWRAVHEAVFTSTKIVVAALERAAVNGGAALALAADFLVVGAESFLQVGEIQQGMAAPMNVAWLSLRHSEALVARVALLGDRLYGPKLVELGLAHDCVPEGEVLRAAEALATTLASHDPAGIVRIKSSLRAMGPSGGDAAAWFDRAQSADPMAGRSLRPVAARPE